MNHSMNDSCSIDLKHVYSFKLKQLFLVDEFFVEKNPFADLFFSFLETSRTVGKNSDRSPSSYFLAFSLVFRTMRELSFSLFISLHPKDYA